MICCWFGSILIEKKNEKLLKDSIYSSLSQISQDWALVKVKGLNAIIEGNAPSKYDSIKVVRHIKNKHPFLKIENKTTYKNQVSFLDKISFIRVFKENENVLLVGYFPKEGIKKIRKLLLTKEIPIKSLLSENKEPFDPPLKNAIELLQKIIFMDGVVTAELSRNLLSIKMSRQERQNEKQLNSKIKEFRKKNTYPKIEIDYFNVVVPSLSTEKEPMRKKNNNLTEKLPQKEKIYLVLEKKNNSLELKGSLPRVIKSNLMSYISTKHPSIEILDNLIVSKDYDISITNAFIKSINLIDIMEQFKLSIRSNRLEIFGTTRNEMRAKEIIHSLITEAKLKKGINSVIIKKLEDTNKERVSKKKECQNLMFSLNNTETISFIGQSFKITGDQTGFIQSLLIILKKCLIFDPSIIGYGDSDLSQKYSKELGLARASNIFLKALEIDSSIGEINISSKNAKSIFKMEHNQQKNKKIPKIELRFGK